jgi:hypothetical protein
MKMIRQIERRFVGTWRDTTYERDDGSQFRVALPAQVEKEKFANHEAYECQYDEAAESSMLLSLAASHRGDDGN